MTDTERSVFPYEDGDVVVLGPEIFASKDGAVINWKGENYVPMENPEHGEREAELQKFAEWVERDRREPDKLLCHVASMKRAALDAALRDTEERNRTMKEIARIKADPAYQALLRAETQRDEARAEVERLRGALRECAGQSGDPIRVESIVADALRDTEK